MGYCVGNCLSWDSVSGNLTINEDPLGGLECLTGGQRIRIAGQRTGVAVNAQNNGLFMTTAGELATLNTPQQRLKQGNRADVDIQATAGNTSFGYAHTPNIVMTNPSATYYMLVMCTLKYSSGFQIRDSICNVTASYRRFVNGVEETVGGVGRSHSNSGTNHANYFDINQYTCLDYVAPGGTITYAARQVWTVASDTTSAPYFL